MRNRSFLRRFSDCEFAQFVTRVRPLESSIILDNPRGNCRSARASRLLPSNFSATDPTRISPFGDEVALFSAARHSAVPTTSAMVTPRGFGCGCAGLSVPQLMNHPAVAQLQQSGSCRFHFRPPDVTIRSS